MSCLTHDGPCRNAAGEVLTDSPKTWLELERCAVEPTKKPEDFTFTVADLNRFFEEQR